MANSIIWDDSTRIKWKDINGIYLTEYGGTLEEACRENKTLDRNDVVSFFSTIGLQEVDYRDGYPITAKYNEQYRVGYFSWEPSNNEILRFSNSPDRFIRFRVQESNKNGEYVSESNSLASMSGIIYLGDIVFGIKQGELYNWDNYNWNLGKNIIFDTTEGDENTQAKTETIQSWSSSEFSDEQKEVLSRQSKLQTIPKLLIENKYLMKIRTVDLNKTSKDQDGFIIKGLKINNVENNYRFGAFPDIFPVHFVSIYGKDYKDNWKITYQNKRLSFEQDSVITAIVDFDINRDVLIAYKTENDGCKITNHYQIDCLWTSEWEPHFIQFNHITDFNITNYKKLLEEYKGVFEGWPDVDDCIPTILLKTKTVPYKVTINSDGSLINNNTQIKNEWVESILTTPTSTEETIKLANVNSAAGDKRNGCYIGSSRTESIKEGIPINIKITGRRILNNLKSEFTNTSTSSDNKEVSGDVYCDTSNSDIAVGVYLNLTGKIRGLHGCFPDHLFFPIIKSYANYYNNNVDTDNDGITQEDIDKYEVTPNYNGNEKYPFYNFLYASGRGYFKFGLERKTNGEPTNSLYWYDYVIWKNAKSLLS